MGGEGIVLKAPLAPAAVRVYFATAIVGAWLPWLSSRSDEFLAASDPGGTPLEDDAVARLMARVTA